MVTSNKNYWAHTKQQQHKKKIDREKTKAFETGGIDSFDFDERNEKSLS